MTKIDLSISLITYKNKSLLDSCLNSIYQNTKKIHFEVLLVDNASKDGSVPMVKKKFPQVHLIQNKKNLIFTKAHNQNLNIIKGQYFLVLNEDTYIPKGTLEEMVKFMDTHPKVGLASCREVDSRGILDPTCSRLPHPLIEFFESTILGKLILHLFKPKKVKQLISRYRYKDWNRKTNKQVDVVPGSFMLGRKEVRDKIGLFDEGMLLFYEEPDYCQRAKKAGFLSFHVGNIKLIHLKSQAVAKLPMYKLYQISRHDMLYYYRKYFGVGWWAFLELSNIPDTIYWKIKPLNEKTIKKN